MSRDAVALILMSVLSCGLPAVRAQGREPNVLGSLTGLNCSFLAWVSGSWPDGEPRAMVKAEGLLTLRIRDIDIQDGRAELVRSGSPVHVVAQLSGWNLHFLEAQRVGLLTVTTVFAQESRDKKLKAVHTRTDFVPVTLPGLVSGPTVSQHYGECEVQQ